MFVNASPSVGIPGSTSLPSSASSSGYQSLALSSPQSSLSSLYSSHRTRFMSSKGFELEDDIEFCPQIVNFANHSPVQTHSSNIKNSVFMSPSSPSTHQRSPRVHTPRVRKALDIVNPHTGMRIESSKLSPQTAK
ncbi:hypothetical protein FOA43_002935 [Brettanomyces nanus]|uniref:Uncharacterized protein n=1 Tax=Eeniella nana TaxID=13502 RepID=A0A875S3P8_EENNA|nr:uncharacterized protein FOA43_002935 [Brettanomyces nanus]QPG75578.1 hypothetical protein FOA43_002935 [Brettanomyces nanus]